MKKIFLYKGGRGKDTASRIVTDIFVLVDDEDYEYLNQWTWSLMSIYHTGNRIFYARRYEGSTMLKTYKAILMHRVILGLNSKDQKGDHLDGDGLNNQRHNLRCLTHAENLKNAHRPNKKTGNLSRGVIALDNMWGYVFRHQQKTYQKSNFKTKEDAELAYNKKLNEVKDLFLTSL